MKISLKTNILQTKTRKKRIIHKFNKIWKLPNIEFQTTTQNKVLKWTLFWSNTSKIESMKNGIKQFDCMEFFEFKNEYFCNLLHMSAISRVSSCIYIWYEYNGFIYSRIHKNVICSIGHSIMTVVKHWVRYFCYTHNLIREIVWTYNMAEIYKRCLFII